MNSLPGTDRVVIPGMLREGFTENFIFEVNEANGDVRFKFTGDEDWKTLTQDKPFVRDHEERLEVRTAFNRLKQQFLDKHDPRKQRIPVGAP